MMILLDTELYVYADYCFWIFIPIQFCILSHNSVERLVANPAVKFNNVVSGWSWRKMYGWPIDPLLWNIHPTKKKITSQSWCQKNWSTNCNVIFGCNFVGLTSLFELGKWVWMLCTYGYWFIGIRYWGWDDLPQPFRCLVLQLVCGFSHEQELYMKLGNVCYLRLIAWPGWVALQVHIWACVDLKCALQIGELEVFFFFWACFHNTVKTDRLCVFLQFFKANAGRFTWLQSYNHQH